MIVRYLLVLTVSTALVGCDMDYWWSRGQPPASSTLLTRSEQRLVDGLAGTNRGDVRKEFELIKSILDSLNAELSTGVRGAKLQQNLGELAKNFAGLEGKLSFGSRPAFGELLSQLQGFEQMALESGTVDANVFKLYSARTMFFLSNELSVLPPVGAAPVVG